MAGSQPGVQRHFGESRGIALGRISAYCGSVVRSSSAPGQTYPERWAPHALMIDCGVIPFAVLYSTWIARLRLVSSIARRMLSVTLSA